MFRLVKLAIYGIIGYSIYEFFRGMVQGEGAMQQSGGGSGGRRSSRAFDEGSTRGMNITGPGRGEDVTTQDPQGMSTHHRVGRGVVSR